MEIEMPRLLALVSASALVLAFAPAAFARDEPQQEVVRFADLDLDDADDAEELIDRLEAASGRVCGARAGPQPVAQWQQGRACQMETTELAVRDVGHPMVLARYYDVHPRVIIEEGSADPYYDDGYVVVHKKPSK
jgi:UrcA family protein